MTRSRWILLLALVAAPAYAQPIVLRTVPGPLSNGLNELEAQGATLYAGPRLTLTRDGGAIWHQPDYRPLVRNERDVYSIDAQGARVWAGLGFSSEDDVGNAVSSAGGYLTSSDAGQTWRAIPAVFDAPKDTLTPYGLLALPTYPSTGPANAPPLAISVAPSGTVYVAAGFAGLRRIPRDSTKFERIVLPPDDLDEIRPDALNFFEVGPKQVVKPGNRVVGHYNHIVYSVLLDADGVLWAGAYFGLNRSTDGVSWRRFTATGGIGAPTGSYVRKIREQPGQGVGGRSAVWFVTYRNVDRDPATARDGLLVTRDGGATFTQTLVGEAIYDLAFRGSTVYAAGARGLFISDDGGATWRTVRDFYDRDTPQRSIPPNQGVAFSVATTSDGALWVGTGAGLAKSTDGGASWRVFRTAAALASEEPGAVPVETYAYPNPFSPAAVGQVRIRFNGSGAARIRIFDFGMQLVRSLDETGGGTGERELLWDGFDSRGVRVANGPYFYAVEAGGRTVRGKILVVE